MIEAMRSLYRRLRGQCSQNHHDYLRPTQLQFIGVLPQLPDPRNTEHLSPDTELPERVDGELSRKTTAEERADKLWNGVLIEDERDSRSPNEGARDHTRGLGVGPGGAGDRHEGVRNEATGDGSDIDSLYASNLPNGLSNGTNYRHVELSEEGPANNDGDNRLHDVNGNHTSESDASRYSFAIQDNLPEDSSDTESYGRAYHLDHEPAASPQEPDAPTWGGVFHRVPPPGHAAAEGVNGTESHRPTLYPRENGISNGIPLPSAGLVPNFSRPLHSTPFYEQQQAPTSPPTDRPTQTNSITSKTNGFTNGHHYSPEDPFPPSPRSSPLSPAPPTPPDLFSQQMLADRALPTGLPSNSEIYRLLRSSLPPRPLTPTTYDYTIATQAKLIRTLHQEIDSLNEELDFLTSQVLRPMTELIAECKTTIQDYDRTVEKLRQENGMLRDIVGKARAVLGSVWARQWEVWNMVRGYKEEANGKGKGILDWLCGRRSVRGDNKRNGNEEEAVANETYVREAMEMRRVGNRTEDFDRADVALKLRNKLGNMAVVMERNLREMKAETDEVSSMVDSFNDFRLSGTGENVRGMRDV